MKRLALVTFPAAALLLTSCSWTFSPQKSDLQQAEQAAQVAGDDAAAQRTAPIDLLAAATPMKTPVKPVALTQPKVMNSSAVPVTTLTSTATAPTAAKITGVTAAADVAMVKPLAAGPVATPIAAATSRMDAADIQAKVPPNGTAIHLASYRELGSAERGWQILSKSYKELVPLKPLYVAVDLPGKGHILRLYGTGSDAASLKTICNEMHADGAYCASNIAF